MISSILLVPHLKPLYKVVPTSIKKTSFFISYNSFLFKQKIKNKKLFKSVKFLNFLIKSYNRQIIGYMLESPIMEQGLVIFNYSLIHVCEMMQKKKKKKKKKNPHPPIDIRILSPLISSQ
jgi:hypothetical protein